MQQRDSGRSHDQVRRSADYSNYGSSVDMAAPGGSSSKSIDGIVSLSNTGTTSAELTPAGWTYSSKQGTSMAAPHVAGVISLMLAANGGLSPAQVEQILKQTARPFPVSIRGADFTCSSDPVALYHCGAGLLDAGAAVRAADAYWLCHRSPGRGERGGPRRSGNRDVGAAGRQRWCVGHGLHRHGKPGRPVVHVEFGAADVRDRRARTPAGCTRRAWWHRTARASSPSSISAPFTWRPTFNPVAAARLFDTRVGAGGGW